MSGDRRWYKACSLDGCRTANSNERCRVPHHHHEVDAAGTLSSRPCTCSAGGEPGTKVGG